MVGKIAASLADATPEVLRAAGEGHHLNMGPGVALEDEWRADGLDIPDIAEMQRYRFSRIQGELQRLGYDGIILKDPLNIRYATGTTNMQLWVAHNSTRYAWIGADGSSILWDFFECEFLAGSSLTVDEVRPAISSIYFIAGPRYAERAKAWADEMLEVIHTHAGKGARIAIDQCELLGYQNLLDGGVTLGNGQEVMEQARHIKGPDEIKAMRCSVHACETTMGEMREALRPGLTEREVWAVLHEGNIRRAGEWIETQIIASGPRTNPWMQEASSRVIEAGDLLGYDTDLVGAYGMMVDISRTWRVGDGPPTGKQAHVHALALEQLERNIELLRPGTTFDDLSYKAWFPPVAEYRHYCCLFHGVGQCDEYPDIFFPTDWEQVGYEGVLEPNMVLTVEAFVGSRAGGEGVKLENQVLVTESGPELLTHFSLDL